MKTTFVIRISLVLGWCGLCLSADQEEIGRNILLIEQDNSCNGKRERSRCSEIISLAKWAYIKQFTPELQDCFTGAPIDLKVPNADRSIVKCPQKQYKVYPNPQQLTNEYLQTLGINFRIGDYLIVPGEGERRISQLWENGSRKQLAIREEIGQTIFELENIITSFNFRVFKRPDVKTDYTNLADEAKAYYIYTYSPGGTKTTCIPGRKMDLYLSTERLVSCPSQRFAWTDLQLTKDALKSFIKTTEIPWTLP